MGGSSWSLGRILGIEVRVHATWLLTFGLITWGLAGGYFRFVTGAPLLLGAISALLLFGSVLVHELSHSLVAQARGMRVRDITLFIFGGVSNLGGQPRTARDEFWMAAAGPLTSFALAAVFWVAAQAVGGTPLAAFFGSPRALRTVSPQAAVLGYLAVVNLGLGVFNLLPAFPLDGGRVFRSVLWGVTKRYTRATAVASLVGQVFGFLLAGFGILRMVAFGDLVGGLWTIFIGWFLSQAASATRREQGLRESLRGVRVQQVMDAAPALVEAGTSVADVVFEHVLGRGRRRLVVVRDGRPLGVLDAARIADLPRDRWPSTPCEQVMQPVPPSVTPDLEVAQVIEELADSPIPVAADERLVGLLDLRQVLRYAALCQELQMPVSSAQPRKRWWASGV
jgi:Zn-dependent protease/CBS domain-containing protein